MRSRVLVVALTIVGVLAAATIAISGTNVAPSRQWAVVNLQNATKIANAVVTGPILVVHDDTKMANGQPCTSVFRFVPGKGPEEEIVAFHCKPRRGPAAETFTFTRQTGMGVDLPGGTLTAYQFAGDTEIHGVPSGQ